MDVNRKRNLSFSEPQSHPENYDGFDIREGQLAHTFIENEPRQSPKKARRRVSLANNMAVVNKTPFSFGPILGSATQPASTKAGDDGGEIGLKDIAKLIQNQAKLIQDQSKLMQDQSIQLVALNAKVDKSLAGVAQINTRLDTLERKMDSANGRISNLENKVDDVESELQVLRAESTARKQEVEKFRDDYENFKKQMQAGATGSSRNEAAPLPKMLNTVENLKELDRSRKTLFFAPCYVQKGGDENDIALRKAAEKYLIDALGYTETEAASLRFTLSKRGKKGVSPCTLEARFLDRDERDATIRRMANLATANASIKDGGQLYKLFPSYPNCLNSLFTMLQKECQQIRDLGKYRAQIRYTDCDDYLAVYVRSNDDGSPARFWRERNMAIHLWGEEGFPPISIARRNGCQ